MAVVSAAGIVGLSACGNWTTYSTDAGQLGLTVDAAGQPVIAVMTCTKTTAAIDMFEGRKKSDPENKVSVERGDWVAGEPSPASRSSPSPHRGMVGSRSWARAD